MKITFCERRKNKTNYKTHDWAKKKVEELGAGEIFDFMDFDGTKQGFDVRDCSMKFLVLSIFR